MSIEILGFSASPYIQLPDSPGGVFLAVLTATLVVVIFLLGLRDFVRLKPGQWLWFGALLLAAPFLAEILMVRSPGSNLLSPPGIPAEARGPALAVFGAVPWVLAGGLLGVGPAVVVGFAAGLARGLWDTYSLFTPLETAILAGLVAYLMQQDYRGAAAAFFRHPAIAAFSSAAVFWPFLYLTFSAYSPAPGFAGLDYVGALVAAAAPLRIIETLVGGMAAELLRTGLPTLWPQKVAARPAPYSRSLNRRILFRLIPLGVFAIAVLYWADTLIAINVATRLVVDQMGRSAENAAGGIPFFISSGRSLIKNLASNSSLLETDPADLPEALQRDLRSVPFFSQLVLFDAAQQPVAGYPEDDFRQLSLSALETQAIVFGFQGVPQDVTLYPEREGAPVLLAFVAPVLDASGAISGVLLGRTDLDENPLMQPVITGLQNVVAGQGVGFLVDEAGRVVYHPDPRFLGTGFELDANARRLATRVEGGQPYRDVAPDGTRRLVYYLPVSTHPWSVVIQMPNNVVLALATEISTPLVVILLIIGVAGLAIISFLAQRLTSPLESLAVAVAQMTEGDLSRPMQIGGEDEVGRLSLAFDAMRQRLRARLDELNLLFTVSQGVAGSLSLDESLPPILQGALAASGAAGARLALPAREEAGAPASEATPQIFTLGPAAPAMAPLDGAILRLTREEGKAVIENLARARAVLDASPVAGKIQALIALPLMQEGNYLGALWLGYDTPHIFHEAEENFFTTLAGQAALAVVNARLFETAERGRERLAAILASTPDPVIVTDRHERLLLINPAAQFTFGVDPRASVNRPIAQVIKNPALVMALRTPGADPATNEVPMEGGVTLYASTSPIHAADGQPAGRVTVLRDVTRFKELEHLKSEFVDTVSHDLRSPLTYIRGYATMLPMVGTLNDKQQEFVDKMVRGINQMTALISDLLDIGRIEAGVGLQRQAVKLGDLMENVNGPLRQQAVGKGLTLSVDLPPDLPAISGDRTLLQQAVSNLVENAIKYTPRGGEVVVRAGVQEGALVFSVQDTGYGIAPADQDRLFEKFYRVHLRETTDIKGTGLGLAIVKSIAERHGGRVWCVSQLGQGSTFYLAVPLSGQ